MFEKQTDAENAFKGLMRPRILYFYITGIVTRYQKRIDCNGTRMNMISALLKYNVINFMFQNVAYFCFYSAR